MKVNINQFINALKDSDLISLYSKTIKELKSREIIRTSNVIGDLGEYIAVDYYCSTPNLPKLQAAPIGTQNIDAISINGDRYSIKSTSTTTTGVFYGLNDPNSSTQDIQKFEYVIIVKFDKDYQLEGIYELSWDTFIKHKRWHSRMNAWNLSLTKNLISDSKIIYQK